LDSNKKQVSLKSTQIGQNRKGLNSIINGLKINCDLPTNLWRDDRYHNLVTYSISKNDFNTTYSETNIKHFLQLNVNQEKLKLMEGSENLIENDSDSNVGLIASILRTFHHPRFYY
jgi:hypothetical protein